jgi:hypothetical protein
MESAVAWDGAFGLRLCLFLSCLADNDIGAEGAGRLAEPLGKLTALQELDLRCTVLSCFWLRGRRVMLLGMGLLGCVFSYFSIVFQGTESALKGQGGWRSRSAS